MGLWDPSPDREPFLSKEDSEKMIAAFKAMTPEQHEALRKKTEAALAERLKPYRTVYRCCPHGCCACRRF